MELASHCLKKEASQCNIYSLSPLNVCHEPAVYPCMCRDCLQVSVTSFHLAYFLHFGLRFDTFVKEKNGCCWFKITPSVVWQSYAILEKRINALKQAKVPSLQSLCYYSLTQHCPHLEKDASVPTFFRKNLKLLHASFDLMDKELCFTAGNSLFHPLTFPKFVYFHVGKYIGGFSKHEMMRC